jgi:hypothetical protein
MMCTLCRCPHVHYVPADSFWCLVVAVVSIRSTSSFEDSTFKTRM